MATLTVQPLGSFARGAIGQGAKPAQEALNLLEGGDFTRSATQWLFGICGDERCDVHGTRLLLPAGFGGFASIVVTDALTIRRWYKPGMSFAEHARKAWEDVQSELPEVTAAVHTDAKAKAALDAAGEGDVVECGCAAIAKAGAVLQLLVAQQDQIDSAYRAQIVANAQELLATGYAQPNTARTVATLGKDGLQVEVLAGEHDGVALIVNKVPGTVIDRPELYKACEAAGVPKLSAFAYDQWAMQEAAEKLAGDDADLFFAAGDALMFTTIRAIASPALAVITLE